MARNNKTQNALERQPGARPPMTREEMAAHCKRIVHYLKTEKRYTQPTYSLWELSHELGMSTRTVSTAINAYMGQDFFNLIARIRVEESKRLLRKASKSAKKISLEEIGAKSGFNSRSSFFYCFKKYTGMTPGKYMILHED
ncbi:helix-turn-helix domain-containing protein [Parabacteroides sp.]